MSVTITLSPAMELEQQLPEEPVPRASDTEDRGDDIRKGIPNFAALTKWRRDLLTQARLEAARKLDKGKKVETVRNRVNGRPAPVELPCNGAVKQGAVNTRAPTKENGAILGPPSAEGQQARRVFFGLELPQPPPPTRNAPPVPPEPVELPSTGIIPISLPFSKLERVRQMEFRSSKQVNAREVRLSKTEVEKLRTFSEFVGTPNQIALFGRHLPQCHRYAVQLEVDGSNAQTYICIEGLKKKEDIRDFYAVMSQKKYRKYYEPWKFCFRMAAVSNAAFGSVSPVFRGPGMEEVAASYHINLRKGGITLCGSTVQLRTESGERLSTIGGLIQVGTEYFALTTAHDSVWPDSTTSTLKSSHLPVLTEGDFVDQTEKILVITEDSDPQETTPAEMNWPHTEELVSSNVYEHQVDDWCLIPIPEEYQLPNADFSSGQHLPFTFITSIYRGDPADICVYRAHHKGGKQLGQIGKAPSFLDGLNGPIEVWAVTSFDRRFHPDLQQGDSGTWFLTAPSQVFGPAIARCPGKILITSLARQFDSIAAFFPDESSPRLPQPLPLLLRAAKNYSLSGDDTASDSFTNMLLDVVRNPLFPSTPLTLALRWAAQDWDSNGMTNLRKLILISGSDLESTLKDVPREDSSSPKATESTLQKLALLYHTAAEEQLYLHRRSDPGTSGTGVTPAQPKTAPPPRPLNTPYPPFASNVSAHPETMSDRVPEVYNPQPYNPQPYDPQPYGPGLYAPEVYRLTLKQRVFWMILAPFEALYHFLRFLIKATWYTARQNRFVLVVLLFCAAYFVGGGVGAWKLLTSDLSNTIKIVVGVLLITTTLSSLIWFWYTYARRVHRSRSV